MKGLPNAGQTCYFNAAVQCLAYCPNLTNYMLAGCAATDVNAKRKGASAVAAAFAAFVKEYWTVEGDGPDPSDLFAVFAKACKFKTNTQHDAHEALVCLLDKLHEGLSRLKPGDLSVALRPEVCRKPWVDSLKSECSVVSEVFRGQLETQIQAPGYTSVSYDHFTCLSLAVGDSTSLALCLQRHMAPEAVLDFKVDDQTVVEASLAKRFAYLPRVLVVQLKRFDGRAKIDRFVDYPAELDLSAYAAPQCQHHYQLFAVCMHRGTMDDGHYAVLGEVKGKWFAMDDETVTPVTDINRIIDRDAYMLLYKRL